MTDVKAELAKDLDEQRAIQDAFLVAIPENARYTNVVLALEGLLNRFTRLMGEYEDDGQKSQLVAPPIASTSNHTMYSYELPMQAPANARRLKELLGQTWATWLATVGATQIYDPTDHQKLIGYRVVVHGYAENLESFVDLVNRTLDQLGYTFHRAVDAADGRKRGER